MELLHQKVEPASDRLAALQRLPHLFEMAEQARHLLLDVEPLRGQRQFLCQALRLDFNAEFGAACLQASQPLEIGSASLGKGRVSPWRDRWMSYHEPKKTTKLVNRL